MELLILGGTGLAGRAVRDEALARGHTVRVLARREPAGALPAGVTPHIGDTFEGTGLHEAMSGADAVVDCTNIVTLDRVKATTFFVTSVNHAAAAACASGVGRYVLLSIVGVDRTPMGYYQAKLAQEQALLAATANFACRPTIARTTQFHDFAAQTLARSSVGPLAFVPSMRMRPVELGAVARHLVSTAESGDLQMAPELRGPCEEALPDMVRRYCSAAGVARRVIPVRIPGRAGKLIRQGVLIPRDGAVDGVAFDDWLARSRALLTPDA